jgi:mono/diheme cytochrome c family protein
MIRFALILICALAVFSVLSCSNNTQPISNVVVNSVNRESAAPTPLPSATIDELASGRKVYAASCSNCHQDDGTGGEVTIEGKTIKPDDLTSAKIKAFSDDKILGYIMNGVEDEGMPAFKGKLSEGEMRDVVKFIRVELQKMPATPQSPSPKS